MTNELQPEIDLTLSAFKLDITGRKAAAMMTKDERKQAINFQDAIGEIVDQYLKEGMDVDIMKEVLRDEAGTDLHKRREEIEA